ncbi:MAG: cation diffusion facilitator family transporter [Aggregatilineales bacterium]
MDRTDPAYYGRVRRTIWRVLAVNLLVTVSKLVVGFATGSLALIADGFHSATDMASNLIGIIATRIAGRPPDADHPYGHRRFETLATLAIGGLLLVAAWEVIQEVINRLITHTAVNVTPISFAVVIGTIVLNLGTTLYSQRNGQQLQSDLLLASAADSRTDVIVSAAVLFGLVATALGYQWLDTLIAVLIVVLISRTAFEILLKMARVLTDTVAIDANRIRRVVTGVPGVEQIDQIRSRGPADAIYVDVDALVEPATTADHAEAIAKEIKQRVKDAFPGVVEVQVEFLPRHDQKPNVALVARAAADALGLSVHEVAEIMTDKGVTLEMHVEVASALTLAEAHHKVSQLETRIRAEVPDIREVLTHIEPASEHPWTVAETTAATALRDQAIAMANRLYPHAHWHAAAIHRVAGGYALSLHCWLPGSLNVEAAHAVAEQVETQIRAALPQVQRVTIHTEPPENQPEPTLTPVHKLESMRH